MSNDPTPVDPAAAALDATRELTAEERRNLVATDRWLELYNGDDMEAFVREAYRPELRVWNFDGVDWRATTAHRHNKIDDIETFIKAEKWVLRSAPGRKARFDRRIPAGNVVVVEATLLDTARPGWELAWCAIWTYVDGQIANDHSYLNHRDWPGVVDMLGR